MSQFIDMTGWKMWEHGVPDSRLTVVAKTDDYVSPSGEHKIQWICECNCGTHDKVIATGSQLKRGKTKSCGCLKKEKTALLSIKSQPIASAKASEINKKYNRYDLSGDYGIGFTANNKQFYFDLEDYDLIKNYCWHIDDKGYVKTNVYTNGKHEYLSMHRLVMNAHPDAIIDHKKHNTSDNRKQVLRVSNDNTNMFNHAIYRSNTSGVTGVNWDKDHNKWRARIWALGKTYNLGRFDNFDDAVMARKEAEEKYFGEFSYDNSIKENINELQQSS